MQKHFHIEQAAQFLRNARMGGIPTPDQLGTELRRRRDRTETSEDLPRYPAVAFGT